METTNSFNDNDNQHNDDDNHNVVSVTNEKSHLEGRQTTTNTYTTVIANKPMDSETRRTSETGTSVVSAPRCAHGPTLLFERFDPSTKTMREFYACAAFRDRRACPFFQWKESADPSSKTGIAVNCETESAESHRKARKRYLKFKALPRETRHVCCTCGRLLLEGELTQHQVKGHTVNSGVTLKSLKRPSFLFAPRDDNKTYAQYLFSKTCVDFTISTLTQMNFSHILCVGAPRIHEEIQTQYKGKLKSFLLDLDERYAQIYPPSKFGRYNMFNDHFFEECMRAKTAEFLREGRERVVLVTDPPFGGMVQALAASFSKLSHMWADGLTHSGAQQKMGSDGVRIPTVWFFPYFLEHRILADYPGMAMLDYKVSYDNHSVFHNAKKQKGSPVRLFTNIPPAQFKLPHQEGYWFCEKCQRYSAQENQHCDECKACTSKDGTTYRHCDMCSRCVKPSRQHCFQCQRCEMSGHVCGQVKGLGCYICGGEGHKKRDCPNKGQKAGNINAIRLGKRKRTCAQKKTIKKKRKR